MRFTTIVLLIMVLFIACENPADDTTEEMLYKGTVVQEEPAPFLVNSNSLARIGEAVLVIDDAVADGTVYGSKTDTEVYAAEGGEVLPKDTWVDNIGTEPVEVGLTSKVTIVFEQLTSVTIVDAIDMYYIDENGDAVAFSGSGVVEATIVYTGDDGIATIISTTKFAIGGGGGDVG